MKAVVFKEAFTLAVEYVDDPTIQPSKLQRTVGCHHLSGAVQAFADFDNRVDGFTKVLLNH